MKIYNAAIIGLGTSGLAVNKLIYDNTESDVIAFETENIHNRNNFFGFWLTDWMLPYEKLIEKKWHKWVIGNSKTDIVHEDNINPYCVISFRTWKEYCLNTTNNLKIENKKVVAYFQNESFFTIITDDKKKYYAKKIYDSRSGRLKNNELSQQFLGLNIITKDKSFDQNKLTLMKFTNENDTLHFIYLLPFSENQALVESTVFSKSVFNENWYREKIKEFLVNSNINSFKEVGTESGTIPMFFLTDKVSKNANIFNIGIRGGACKPSTGYAFSFLIRQIQLIKKTNRNNINVHGFLEKKMDKVFINYLKNNNESGASFINLAKNLNGKEFQSFMMGKSNFITKLKIIKSMPKIPFIKALIG